MRAIAPYYKAIQLEIGEVVQALTNTYGIPTDIEQSINLADQLYPAVTEQRAALATIERRLILAENPGVTIAQPQTYHTHATFSIVSDAAGLGRNERPMIHSYMDPITRQKRTSRLAPYTLPDDDAVIQEFTRRLTASGTRHALQVSRSMISDTAGLNKMAWARQLTGRENCAFCCMLASRGAVYTSREAATTVGGWGFKEHYSDGHDRGRIWKQGRVRGTQKAGDAYHDNCDCTAVLIADPKSNWDGKRDAEKLKKVWNHSSGLTDFRKNLLEEGIIDS